MLLRPAQMPAEKNRRMEVSEFDWFSGLPDDLLIDIMCFLGARDAVNTCILSKRWKNLWRYLPCLNFDNRGFESPIKFTQFIDSFFDLRSPSRIDIFELTYHAYADIDGWLGDMRRSITRVLESRPRVLSIKCFSDNEINFNSVYACASAEAMELHSIFLPYKEPITLASLRRLNLTRVTLRGKSVNNLISGCPTLEDLVIRRCKYFYDITIISHKLKTLCIEDCKGFYDYKIHLSIPSLVSLCITRVTLGKIYLKNLSSIVKAHLEFREDIGAEHWNSNNELLRGLSNATYVGLGIKYLKTMYVRLLTNSVVKDLLEKELPNCPAFDNLKSLYLVGWDMCDFFSPISHFVQLSPNLETLILGLVEPRYRIAGENESKELYSQIHCEHLKTVRIIGSTQHQKIEKLRNTLKANFESIEKIEVI